MLYAYRDGDADMRFIWLCSRNDAIGNIAVMLAAAGVFGTGLSWPDLVVAALMGLLALSSGISVIRHAQVQRLRDRRPRQVLGRRRGAALATLNTNGD